MPPRGRKSNGHRWRQITARVKAEESHCALCDGHVDQSLHHLDPMAASVDHIIPVDRGGPEYQRSNCTLMHRRCNRWKSTLTLAEARMKWLNGTASRPDAPVQASSIW